MSSFPSTAARLDRAVDQLLEGAPPDARRDPALRPLIEVAALVRAALAPVPPGVRFQTELGRRLAREAPLPSSLGVVEAVRAVRGAAARELRHPGRLLLTGALSSAAVGAGVTAYALWRGARRPAAVSLGIRHRPGHR